jgi:hypothetical protein
MVYRPQDNSLYFSEPTSHTLRRLGLATGKLETLFFNDPRIPAPAALCLEGDKLDLSDLNLPVVFRADPSKPLPAKGQTFPLEQAGKGCRVDRLVVSDGILYGLGMGDNPLVRIGTDACTPVTLASPWGFQLANDVVNLQPFLTVDRERPMGLAADPGRPRQLFVSSPLSFIHTIVAVKDYDFGTYWTARSRSPGVPDFNYPHVKSSKTFRILVLGDSRVVSAFQFPTDPKTAVGTPSEQILHSPRVLTFPKRLEFLLNTQAALEGSDTRFEVICEGKPGEPTSYLSRYEGPRLAKTFDVDLVFNFEVPFATETYDYYVDRPLTKEGIPQEDMDAEFRVKPFDQRVPTAGASRDLYDRWRKPGLPGAAGPLTAPPRLDELLRVHDPGVDQDLTEMLGKPLRLLAEDLHSLRTSGGKQVGFFLCFAPSRDGGNAPVEDYRGFWRGLCAQKGIAFMDLTDGYNALADSFFPSLDSCCHGHFNAYGNELLATLIGRELSARKWVPTAASGDRQSP